MLCLVTQSCPTLCSPMDCSLIGSSVHGDSPGKNTGVGCHALLQGIFPTQALNLSLPRCRKILYHLSHQGSPFLLAVLLVFTHVVWYSVISHIYINNCISNAALVIWASLVAQLIKNPPAMWETCVRSLGWEDPLDKGKATHSSILAWRIPWTV